MNNPLRERMVRDLEDRTLRGTFRALRNHADAATIDCSTNSYLNLHRNERARACAMQLAGGDLSGNLASRLISDRSPLAGELEAEIAQWHGTEAALLFTSGYAANLAIIGALCTRKTEVFSDRLNHASIVDGIRLAGCRVHRYRHCDMTDLRDRLRTSPAAEKLVITDTVFSMDGDRAPIADICALAREYGAMIMVDEAHATGVFGKHGEGLGAQTGCAAHIDIHMGTLSKAVAGLGGFFAGSALLRDYLVNHGRSFIYSTGLPASVLAWDLAALRHIRAAQFPGRDLLDAAGDFRDGLRELGFETMNATTQIVPCIVKEAERAVSLSAFLRERGIAAPAIRPPTVPPGTSRIRFSLHAGLTGADLAAVLSAFQEWRSSND